MYRILSPTAILGYGFPKSSFDNAMQLDLDLIAVDAGSVDAGPYYLGSGKPFMGSTAVKRDLELLISGAIEQQCPLIIGSAGFSGARPAVNAVYHIVKNILEESGLEGMRVGIIYSDVSPDLVVRYYKKFIPLGRMPPLDERMIRDSIIVGQMGVEPIIAALDSGADILICGRAYDPAIFAADPIRKGFPKGISFHAAKILECGAIACEPGDGSDCLIGELHMDGRAIFYPVAQKRKVTVKSIAAHTLYEKSRPDLFHLPGGILTIQNTRFFQVSSNTAGLTGSEFKSLAYSIKLEGSRSLGHKIISIIPVTGLNGLDESILVYGRNGVEDSSPVGSVNEIGILITVKSKELPAARDALSFIRATMLHYGYPGRISTAGNLAFPFSPADITYRDEKDDHVVLFIAGTRDPVFQTQWEQIKFYTLSALAEQHPVLFGETEIDFTTADKTHPIAVLETIGDDQKTAQKSHREKLKIIERKMDLSRPGFLNVDMGETYVWSVHHVTHDMELICELFPIEMMEYRGSEWNSVPVIMPRYDTSHKTPVTEDSLENDTNSIQESTGRFSHDGEWVPLSQVAQVIRSKNAGINQITFDIFFNSERIYKLVLQSGIFSKASLSKWMLPDKEMIVGCYYFDPALAVKFTFHRKNPAGGPGERDVFGAQQHSRLLDLMVPAFND